MENVKAYIELHDTLCCFTDPGMFPLKCPFAEWLKGDDNYHWFCNFFGIIFLSDVQWSHRLKKSRRGASRPDLTACSSLVVVNLSKSLKIVAT